MTSDASQTTRGNVFNNHVYICTRSYCNIAPNFSQGLIPTPTDGALPVIFAAPNPATFTPAGFAPVRVSDSGELANDSIAAPAPITQEEDPESAANVHVEKFEDPQWSQKMCQADEDATTVDSASFYMGECASHLNIEIEEEFQDSGYNTMDFQGLGDTQTITQRTASESQLSNNPFENKTTSDENREADQVFDFDTYETLDTYIDKFYKWRTEHAPPGFRDQLPTWTELFIIYECLRHPMLRQECPARQSMCCSSHNGSIGAPSSTFEKCANEFKIWWKMHGPVRMRDRLLTLGETAAFCEHIQEKLADRRSSNCFGSQSCLLPTASQCCTKNVLRPSLKGQLQDSGRHLNPTNYMSPYIDSVEEDTPRKMDETVAADRVQPSTPQMKRWQGEPFNELFQTLDRSPSVSEEGFGTEKFEQLDPKPQKVKNSQNTEGSDLLRPAAKTSIKVSGCSDVSVVDIESEYGSAKEDADGSSAEAARKNTDNMLLRKDLGPCKLKASLEDYRYMKTYFRLLKAIKKDRAELSKLIERVSSEIDTIPLQFRTLVRDIQEYLPSSNESGWTVSPADNDISNKQS